MTRQAQVLLLLAAAYLGAWTVLPVLWDMAALVALVVTVLVLYAKG